MVVELGDRHPQDALDDAPRNGMVVADGGKQHTLDGAITVTTPGITLVGLDLRLADAADENVIEIAADGVRLADFRIDGNRGNQPGDRESNGVVVTNATDVTIENGHIERVSRHGVLLVGSNGADAVNGVGAAPTSNLAVRGVRVKSPRRDGCSVQGPEVSNVTVESVRTFDSSDRGSVEIKDGASDAVVTGCYGEGNRYGCTIQDHGEHGVENVILANNTAVACDTAIDAQTSVRHGTVAVVGNAGRELAGEGMGGPGGIYMGRVDGLVVANNVMDGIENRGIVVEECIDAEVTGNVVRGIGTGSSIDVVDAPGALVNGNIAGNGDGDGICCRATGGTTMTDLQVGHNRCTGHGGAGIRLIDDGGQVDHALVSSNVVRGNDGGGVVDGTDAGNVLLAHNLA